MENRIMEKLFKKYKTLPQPIKASFWFLICSFLQKGISTITTPIFTRLLSPAEYGQYNVFNSWLSVLAIFVTLNLYAGVYTQGLIKFSSERRVYSSALQGMTASLCIAWTVVYFLFHDFWNELFSLTTVQMLAMLVMIWTTAVFNFWAAEQRVEYKYRQLVTVTLLVSIAKPAIGVVFVINAQDKVTARILGLVLVELIAYSCFFVIQMKQGKCFFSAKFWKHALFFNLPLVPHYLSQTVLSSADRIMIEKMIGAEAAGIYSLAYSISLVMTLFNTALSQTMSPWIYQKIKDKKESEISSIAYLALGLIALFNLVLIAFAPEVVRLFAPPTYHDAIWVIPPVAMSVVFTFSYDLFAKFAFYYEKTNFIMLASVSGAMLNVALNYICIRIFGYYAAGYTTLFCYIVYAFAHYCCMRKICKKDLENVKVYNVKTLLTMYTAFLGSGFLLLVTYRIPVVRYLLIVVGGIVLFCERKKLIESVGKIVKIRKKNIM